MTGGDPLFQPHFSLAIIRSCKTLGIHCAVETSGFASYEMLKQVGQASDLILYDIKHMDEASHTRGTGHSNKLILDNLSRFCLESSTSVAVRIPLITGFNDSAENIRRTAQFVSSLKKVERLDLLPFNQLASAKYHALGLEWVYERAQRQSDDYLNMLKNIVEDCGLHTAIGGLW